MSFTGNDSGATIEKDGLVFTDQFFNFKAIKPDLVVKGPATFKLVGGASPTLLTLKVMPEAYPPDKSVIVAPTTNQVQITLESSTNLVNWASATNGVYGSPDEARFFRIHLQKLN